ncbi:SatD family protein [Janibacter sp. G56]|uniref:SatD family protein n=1 Tax=Janibacter sp. G56 TaxID=3418717 RepID=UPI003CFC0C5B
MTSTSLVATLIGDVIGSPVADRPALHERLTRQLDLVNEQLSPVEPLAITVGDEFQGAFGTIGAAIDAALRIRLGLLPLADLRCGLAWGEVTILDAARRTQDGPAWWAAREAIGAAKEAETDRVTAAVRTVVAGAGPGPDAVNAAVAFRDLLLDDLDDRSRAIVAGLLEGRTKAEIAERVAISPSAVSQRAARHGLDLIARAEARLAATDWRDRPSRP